MTPQCSFGIRRFPLAFSFAHQNFKPSVRSNLSGKMIALVIFDLICSHHFIALISSILLLLVLRFYIFVYFIDSFRLRRLPGPFLAKFSRLWLAYISRRGRRYQSIHQAHLKYGKIIRIAPNEISIADPDATPIVLGHGTRTTKSDFYDAFVSVRRGLFNTRDRSEHARKRKIVSGTFSQRNVLEFEPLIASIIQTFIKKWDQLSISPTFQRETLINSWKSIDCLPWLNFLAFDIIGDLAFGEPFGMVERAADVTPVERDGKVIYLSAIDILNSRGEYSMTLGCLPPFVRPYVAYFDPWFSRGRENVKNLTGIARNQVNKRLAQPNSSRKDLLARLQEGTDANGNPMGVEELTAEALTQLIAGSDTTSNSSCAILWWIVKHPNVHQKLLKELDEKLGGMNHSGVVSYNDSKDLVYLNACINEGLRRHSTSSIGLPRVMPKTVDFKGHLLIEGVICSIPTYEIHHDPEIWGDPWVFRPERWLEPDAKKYEAAFLPFSHGPRACVGRNLAIMQLQIIISTLIKRYDFRLKKPDQAELNTREGFLRKPVDCWIEFKIRSMS
ncbi:hypothetical protein O181_065703 [Austropuccinia psidii MF-1]|uniref:Benzoate 4-monooxygenase cytochrome P450 n=1 Tax=Austropuccinia psidii MF-1 TaxID=1389203 RepID=A0A9Q3EVT8_9BASI|nr:hypothetical protein [Austropuccinia psidii MF-1]